MKFYGNYLKRVIDIVISIMALIILSPIILIIVIIQLFIYKGKPFFGQERPGKNQVIFKIIKFRTMHDFKNPEGTLLSDETRLSSFGRFLRCSSLDEILQFVNILKGDMSLVGPRPLLPEYLPLYNDFQIKRHLVRPGITGWAQVKGRNQINWKERFKLDVWYVENVSFFLDLKILYMTIINVLTARGVKGSDSSTMKKFEGN